MNSLIKGIWLTCTAAALLLEMNVAWSQGDAGWYNIPNPLIENVHFKNQSSAICGGESFLEILNITLTPRKVDDCSQIVTMEVAMILSEDLLIFGCFLSGELDGVHIGQTSISDACHLFGFRCPLLKGKLYKMKEPVNNPCVMNQGEYVLKLVCKNQNDDTIFCGKWTFTWV
ncbi:uncharacterized protein LOC116307779 isoform X2 [Actinia tenebrosa]|nr:uncharacterized protein LOC116307779 isoform X2 [Actinia tenebrosa]XP_031573946.1 uncharacterized protein LOC116307779 isoform X2 [Actinia tenebrosa]XP_031573947.1 uncharacterized protein LOC116307779 isoform X2 [Actinia tenebrosa]